MCANRRDGRASAERLVGAMRLSGIILHPVPGGASMPELSDVTILVTGDLSERVPSRIAEVFPHQWIARADPALVSEELRGRVRGIAAMSGISAAFVDGLPKLEIIASFGVGYDHVDARHAASRDVMVTNTPDVLTEEVADTAIGLLLNTLREF